MPQPLEAEREVLEVHNMKLRKTIALALVLMLAFALMAPLTVFADDGSAADAEAASLSGKAIASGIAIGLAAAGGAVAMGIASGKANEGISRQPEANGQIRSTLMLSLVFIETAIIYALLVVILVIFVL